MNHFLRNGSGGYLCVYIYIKLRERSNSMAYVHDCVLVGSLGGQLHHNKGHDWAVRIYARETKLIEYSNTSHPPGEFLSPTLQGARKRWAWRVTHPGRVWKAHRGTCRNKPCRKEEKGHVLLSLSPFPVQCAPTPPSAPPKLQSRSKQVSVAYFLIFPIFPTCLFKIWKDPLCKNRKWDWDSRNFAWVCTAFL